MTNAPHSRRRAAIVTIAVLAVVAAAGATVLIVRSRESGTGRPIVFSYMNDVGTFQRSIDRIVPGKAPQRLTHPPDGAKDWSPELSPKGDRLAFTREQPDERQVCMLANRDGTHERLLATPGRECADPRFSPDGSRLAVNLTWGGDVGGDAAHVAHSGLALIDRATGRITQLTQGAGTTTSEDFKPAWSPDGTRLAFTRHNTVAQPVGAFAVEVMPVTGGTPVRLTNWNLWAGNPAWAPDGTRIAVQSWLDCPHEAQLETTCRSQIFTVAPDGAQLQQVTRGAGHFEQPAYAPDTGAMVFTWRRTAAEVDFPRLMLLDQHRGQQALTDGQFAAADPTWAP